MVESSCIFCKIISRQIPSSVILENDSVIVIKDIYPKASIHYLVIPKKHIRDIVDLSEDDSLLAWNMLSVIKKLAEDVPNKAFNLVVNNGQQAGQMVFHLHWHFLASTEAQKSEFSL